MSSYAQLSIGKYDYFNSRNEMRWLLLIYNPSDRIWNETNEDGETCTAYKFVTTVLKAKQCLDVAGFNLEKLQKRFDTIKEDIKFMFSIYFGGPDDFHDDELNGPAKEAFERYDYESWHQALISIAAKLSKVGWDWSSDASANQWLKDIPKDATASYVIAQSLPDQDPDNFFGLSEIDPWMVFRAILDAFDDDEEVILDYTDLVDGGWCNACPNEKEFDFGKTIILTEGKFDSEVISRSLPVLYPHLSKFYGFMNFELFDIRGSASFLVHYIKAFIAAGIYNNVIGLFDNDAAAEQELRNLPRKDLPPNIVVMQLPGIDIAKEYPTIGPNRDEKMDINGLACSIELFFGKDVLCGDDGAYVPIMWKAYMEKVRKYQGEISKKGQLQKRFLEKLSSAEEKGISNIDDWKEMKILVDCIIKAFRH